MTKNIQFKFGDKLKDSHGVHCYICCNPDYAGTEIKDDESVFVYYEGVFSDTPTKLTNKKLNEYGYKKRS